MNKRVDFLFGTLGPNAQGGPLLAPFTDATVYDVACAIAVALAEAGLTPQAIGQVGLALTSLTRFHEFRSGTLPPRKEPPPWPTS